ncbi:MAG: SDR family oxidoreductase [Microscillaceae bacterium]|nr:SDR family oxidoreductase [Microscillaceae bacterium]MDW8461614.1 SDR family oxidoreductase [Cytophagales bacterium]
MKIAVLGVTGRLGQIVTKLALAEGHFVTGFSRNAAMLHFKHPQLKLIQGDVLMYEQVKEALIGQEAVISVLGARSTGKPLTILSEGMQNIVKAMQVLAIERIIAIGGAGILQETETSLRRDSPNFPTFLQEISQQHYESYQTLLNSGLKWTMVCPPIMPNDEHTNKYRIQADYLPKGGTHISVDDVASFILKELHRNEFIQKRVGIAY